MTAGFMEVTRFPAYKTEHIKLSAEEEEEHLTRIDEGVSTTREDIT